MLRNLAQDPENRASMASTGAIRFSPVSYGMEGREARQWLRQHLSDCSKSAMHRVTVTQELVGLLGSQNSAVRSRAAEALRVMNAEAGHDSRMPIAMAGGIDRFVGLLKDGSVEARVRPMVIVAIDGCCQQVVHRRGGMFKTDYQLPSDGKNTHGRAEHAAAVLCGLDTVPGISSDLHPQFRTSWTLMAFSL